MNLCSVISCDFGTDNTGKKKKITLDVQIFREDLIEVLHGNTRKLRVLR